MNRPHMFCCPFGNMLSEAGHFQNIGAEPFSRSSFADRPRLRVVYRATGSSVSSNLVPHDSPSADFEIHLVKAQADYTV